MSKTIESATLIKSGIPVKEIPKGELTYTVNSRVFKLSYTVDLSQYKTWALYQCKGGKFYTPEMIEDMAGNERHIVASAYEDKRNKLNSGPDIETKKVNTRKQYDKMRAKMSALGLDPNAE